MAHGYLKAFALAPHPQVRAFAVPCEHSGEGGLRLDLAPEHLLELPLGTAGIFQRKLTGLL